MRKYFILILVLLINFFGYAADVPVPSLPGGQGGDGFGSPATPIDMYQFVLFAIAAFLILASSLILKRRVKQA